MARVWYNGGMTKNVSGAKRHHVEHGKVSGREKRQRAGVFQNASRDTDVYFESGQIKVNQTKSDQFKPVLHSRFLNKTSPYRHCLNFHAKHEKSRIIVLNPVLSC